MKEEGKNKDFLKVDSRGRILLPPEYRDDKLFLCETMPNKQIVLTPVKPEMVKPSE